MGSGRYYVRLVRCCCPHDLLSGSEFCQLLAMILGGFFLSVKKGKATPCAP